MLRARRRPSPLGALTVAFTVGLGALLAACGDDGDDDERAATTEAAEATTSSTEAESATRPDVPEGYELIDDPTQGFAVALPEGWEQIELTPERLDEIGASVTEDNPDLGRLLQQAQSLLAQGATLFAFDRTEEAASASEFTTNVNIVRTPNEVAQDLDALQRQTELGLESAGATGLESEQVELATGQALRVTYLLPVTGPDGSTVNVAGTQYYVVDDENVWVVTLSTDRPDDYTDTFETIASTFTLL